MSKTIGVLGCGWLGLPLARELIRSGFQVSGTTTSPDRIEELEAEGIRASCIQITPNGFQGSMEAFLEGLDILVLNIPPGLRKNPEADYTGKVRQLLAALLESNCKRLIYVSSTSVYGSNQGEVDERSTPEPEGESGRQLLEAEQAVLNSPGLGSLVLRFGGLLAKDRHPVRFLSGKTGLKGGSDPVNLIHRQDCIRLIRAGIENPDITGVINGVYPEHPLKAHYYWQEAMGAGIAPPQYQSSTEGQNPGSHQPAHRNPKVVHSVHPLAKPREFHRSIYVFQERD